MFIQRNLTSISRIATRNSSTFAKITVIGRAGNDILPLKDNATGEVFAQSLSVVVNNRVKTPGTETYENRPQWFQVLLSPALKVPTAIKGSQIYAEGNIRVRPSAVVVDTRGRGQFEIVNFKRSEEQTEEVEQKQE